MKKIIISVLCLALVLCGCGEKATDNLKINIVATVYAPYEFACAVAGDKADVTFLLKPGSDIHSFEPSPKDMAKINDCDIFIYSGGENDEWVERILSSTENDIKKIKMIDVCEKRETDHTHHEEIHYDEHVWTAPSNAIKITNEICSVLSVVDEENKNYYVSNAEKYIDKLTILDENIKDMVKSAKRDTIVFGDRFPFLHLAEEYNINYLSPFGGCSGESEPDAKTVALLWEKVKEEKIPVVFYTELSDRKMAETLCEGTGAVSLMLHSCHTLSPEDIEKGESYISLMEKNIINLKEALS